MDSIEDQTIAGRSADRTATGTWPLPGRADDARGEADDAQRRLRLLHAIINLLPVGVRVDAEDGRVILLNDAASQFDVSARDAIGSLPAAAAPSGTVTAG